MAAAVNNLPDSPGNPAASRAAIAQFAEELRGLRYTAGLTIKELSAKTHYGRSTIAEAARGDRLPTLEVTLAFVSACGESTVAWRRRWTEVRNQIAHSDDSRSSSTEDAISLRPEQVSTPAEFLAALRDLQRASALSYGGLERASGGQLSRSTLSDMLTGRTMPTWATTRSFIAACRTRLSPLDTSASGDLTGWHYAWERVRATAADQPAHALRRTPVRECDPYQLGVHRAHLPGEDPELPAYVHRGAAELALRKALHDGRNRNGFIVLVGQSGAGKSRLAYELMLKTLDDFELLHPAGADELEAVPQPRTVVWLDDMDQYLRSGLTRAILHALLRGPRPVVILGTIWPSQYHSYMTLPLPGEQDIHQREREALTLATVIDVAARLSPSELDSTRVAARHDMKLAAAMDSSDREIFQTLTAGPHLMRRWHHAGDPYAKALISAAVAARRAGTQNPLTASQLRNATLAYLSASERAQAPRDWFRQALTYATTPVQGCVAALTPVTTAAETGRVDGYHVADFLVQHQKDPDPQPDHAISHLIRPTASVTWDYPEPPPQQDPRDDDQPRTAVALRANMPRPSGNPGPRTEWAVLFAGIPRPLIIKTADLQETDLYQVLIALTITPTDRQHLAGQLLEASTTETPPDVRHCLLRLLRNSADRD